MKLCTFDEGEGPLTGLIEGDSVRPLRDTVEMVELIQRGAGWAPAAPALPLPSVRLLAPIVPMRNVFCVGWNYAEHFAEGKAFRPAGADNIDPRFRDKDEMFWPTSVVLLSYAYNTNALKPNEVPKSALDFLKPQFAGKIVTAYPADDDATLFVFNVIVKKYGWDYMKKYMANKPNFIQGHLDELKSIANGTNVVTFDATNSTTGALKKAGQPIEFAFPTSDVMPTFFITAGIFKGAPHPNAAKLFLTWYLAKDQQSRTGSFSARTDVPPPPGLKPLSSYKIDAGYRELVTDKNIAALRKRFESYTGPVVNKGGVR